MPSIQSGCSRPLVRTTALLSATLFGLVAPLPSQATDLQWTLGVRGATREAIVVASTTTPPLEGAPVIFVFHDAQGSARQARQEWDLGTLFPEAFVVYVDARIDKPAIQSPGRPGRKRATSPETEAAERLESDQMFFDAMLERLARDYRPNEQRIYLFGQGSGATTVRSLWAYRPQRVAAVALASPPATVTFRGLAARSILYIAGEGDPLLPAADRSSAVQSLLESFGADSTQPRTDGAARYERARDGIEVGTYLHPGGRAIPQEALRAVVDFFRKSTERQ